MKNTVPDGHENCTIHDRFCVSAHTRGIVEKRNIRDRINVDVAGMFARQKIFFENRRLFRKWSASPAGSPLRPAARGIYQGASGIVNRNY